ncbi:DUF882 domain-containing protein [Bosea sp. ANAM02]|uniref:YcbK family protein n=1 Tax=Bosea sp. ANAM02 TaxID=2020412 RepID=UPI00156379A3|nr:DUF882 domain-containing protein [Bosea sp. ANAM02]
MSVSTSRRQFLMGLGLGASAIFAGLPKCLAQPAVEAAQKSIPLRLLNPNTREAYDLELFIGDQWNPVALQWCHWLMRDWRQQTAVECDRRLYAALYVLQRYFSENGRITINSGFRTQKTQEALREAGYGPAVNSLHLRAKAVDFTLPGVSMRNVARATWALKLGGVGYYEDMNFVHMDSRGAQARWADSFL